MKIKVFGLADDSIVDGPGLRFAVFTQGCPHHCNGCHNPESHDYEGGEWMETEAILERIRENILLDGVTLSGGEPFEQPEACAEIAKGAKALGLNVWCFTGYTFEQILKKGDAARLLLESIDVLIDSPFVLSQRSLELRFRGSKNQRVIRVPESLEAGQIVLAE